VRRDRLFPFGYFVPAVPAVARPHEQPDGRPRLRVIFVGSLIRRKGVALLVAAVHRLRAQGLDVTLDAYGSGAEQAAGLGFDGRALRHRGLIPFGQAQGTIANHDVLVLPSVYDGWGVVVNEALLAGVPVICSDRVGAKALVQTFGAGSVFPAGDEAALAEQLGALVQDPERRQTQRQAARRAAGCIDPAVAARYMWAVIERRGAVAQAMPPSPWYGVPHG
jgi:glycosyltransferase involved in cell wall biosynthesis